MCINSQATKDNVKLADGSDNSLNFVSGLKQESFYIEEPKTRALYQWIKYQIRHFLILEVLLFIVLVLLLSNSYHVSSQNERIFKVISNIQSQIDSIEKRLNNHDFKSSHSDNQTDNWHKTSDKLVIKEAENSKMNSPHLTKTIPSETKIVEETPLNFPNPEFTSFSINNTIHEFNAASAILGAFIVTKFSSNPVSPEDDDSFSKYYQGEYVLLDRDDPPVYKAWCSIDKMPILTVNLSQYIKPTAVSYQHTKWNGTVPDGAPKTYDLMACLDSDCEKLEPLVSNCEYRPGVDKQKQICPVSPNQNLPPINKIQFRFHRNHGNTNKTCAYLVRVYGEPIDPPVDEQKLVNEQEKIQKEKQRKEEHRVEYCSKVTWYYHNIPFLYNTIWVNKSCRTLYSNKCCTDCPECCSECKMTTNYKNCFTFALSAFVTFICSMFMVLIVVSICSFLN